MQNTTISISAIFLGVITVLALLVMLLVIGVAIYLQSSAGPTKTYSHNTFMLIGIGATMVLSIAFFLAALIASYFAEISGIYGFAQALGTWAILALIFASLDLAGLGALRIRESFSEINSPYVTTDVEVTKLRAITRLNVSAKKERNLVKSQQISRAKHLVSWVFCASLLIGLVASIGAALLVKRRMRNSR